MYRDDPRVIEARRLGMQKVLADLGVDNLKRVSRELVGPCPRPGCGGTDRFSANMQKNLFHCRKCGGQGDVIHLVEMVMGLDFKGALDWLCGPVREIDEAERRKRQEAFARQQRTAEEDEARYRAKAIQAARDVWLQGLPAEGSPVRDYLALRGIPRSHLPDMPICLRYHPALPYMVEDRSGASRAWREVWRGPAMLAAVQGSDGRFSAVHRTWFDLAAPQGKAAIVDPLTGDRLARKKSLGSKQGGAIRLITPPGADTLVIGEGIETTLTARLADALPGAAYWAGVDLGNMAGKRVLRGQGMKYAGIPDLTDDHALLPPDWVRRLIYVMDGDSDPRDTQAKVLAGLRRAMVLRPGLRAQLVRAPQGFDLNDLLLQQDRADG